MAHLALVAGLHIVLAERISAKLFRHRGRRAANSFEVREIARVQLQKGISASR